MENRRTDDHDDGEGFTRSAAALLWRLALMGAGVFLLSADYGTVAGIVGAFCVLGAIIGD